MAHLLVVGDSPVPYPMRSRTASAISARVLQASAQSCSLRIQPLVCLGMTASMQPLPTLAIPSPSSSSGGISEILGTAVEEWRIYDTGSCLLAEPCVVPWTPCRPGSLAILKRRLDGHEAVGTAAVPTEFLVNAPAVSDVAKAQLYMGVSTGNATAECYVCTPQPLLRRSSARPHAPGIRSDVGTAAVLPPRRPAQAATRNGLQAPWRIGRMV
jgi:hypothetical protein